MAIMREIMGYSYGNYAERRGKDSEKRVERVLRTMQKAVRVQPSNKWSPDDMAGIDARVHFARANISGIVETQEVKFQVKSSERGVRDFARKHADIAAETVVVIGQRSYADIRASIDRQLEQMGMVFSQPEQFRKPAPGEEVQIFPSPIPENNLVQFPDRTPSQGKQAAA